VLGTTSVSRRKTTMRRSSLSPPRPQLDGILKGARVTTEGSVGQRHRPTTYDSESCKPPGLPGFLRLHLQPLRPLGFCPTLFVTSGVHAPVARDGNLRTRKVPFVACRDEMWSEPKTVTTTCQPLRVSQERHHARKDSPVRLTQ